MNIKELGLYGIIAALFIGPAVSAVKGDETRDKAGPKTRPQTTAPDNNFEPPPRPVRP